jgi:hypothetical protein
MDNEIIKNAREQAELIGMAFRGNSTSKYYISMTPEHNGFNICLRIKNDIRDNYIMHIVGFAEPPEWMIDIALDLNKNFLKKI